MEPRTNTCIITDAEKEALNASAKMSTIEVSKKVDSLLDERLKLLSMGLKKDAEVKGALASAFAKIWMRRIS